MKSTTVCVDESCEPKVTEMHFESFDIGLPAVKMVDGTLDEILKHVIKENISIYPRNIAGELCSMLEERILELSEYGLAYISKDLAPVLNIRQSTPGNSTMDVLLLLLGYPPTVLTVIDDQTDSSSNAESSDQRVLKAESHNLGLTQGLIRSVRRFTSEQFSAVYGVMAKQDLQSREKFGRGLEELREETSRFCTPMSLSMTRKRCDALVRAFLISVSVSSCIHDEGENLLFLTYEQFRVLTENIDKPEVNVISDGSSGSKSFMREVARRLEKSGPTVLVSESEEQVQLARTSDICSEILSQAEWKDVCSGMTPRYCLVTDCGHCGLVLDNFAKIWTFTFDDGCSKQSFDVAPEERRDNKQNETDDERAQPQFRDLLRLNQQLKIDLEDREMEIQHLKDELAEQREDVFGRLDNISVEVQSLNEGAGQADRQKKTPQTRETGGVLALVRRALLGLATRGGASYVLQNGESQISIQCLRRTMSRSRCNSFCHVNRLGHLSNIPSSGHHQSKSFWNHWGTCATAPLPTPLSGGFHPLVPQYWETETSVEVKSGVQWLWHALLVGLMEGSNDKWNFGSPRSWCVRVVCCNNHLPDICTQVWDQLEHVHCVRQDLPTRSGQTGTLRHGVVVDAAAGRIAFVDVDRMSVLAKLDVRFRENVYPVFGVSPSHDRALVNMKLISGRDVVMTDEKKTTIFDCLS